MKKIKKIISVVGATGIGKTSLAINIAKHLGSEILSCDSRQFFREMPIGTAAPTDSELSEAPHHFIGNLSVQNDYSIGQYEKEALALTKKLFEKHDILVLVGGSGMYEKALLKGLNNLPESNPTNISKLNLLLENEGITSLQNALIKLDSEHYHQIDHQNPRRLIRAIDVIWQTNTPITELLKGKIDQRDFEFLRIGVEAERAIIYQRINLRIDKMIEKGLLNEVKSLVEYRNLTALKTVGYSEIFRFLEGDFTWEECVEEMKKNSRRFAKRQLTWYKKDPEIYWVNYENAWQELKKNTIFAEFIR